MINLLYYVRLAMGLTFSGVGGYLICLWYPPFAIIGALCIVAALCVVPSHKHAREYDPS